MVNDTCAVAHKTTNWIRMKLKVARSLRIPNSYRDVFVKLLLLPFRKNTIGIDEIRVTYNKRSCHRLVCTSCQSLSVYFKHWWPWQRAQLTYRCNFSAASLIRWFNIFQSTSNMKTMYYILFLVILENYKYFLLILM